MLLERYPRTPLHRPHRPQASHPVFEPRSSSLQRPSPTTGQEPSRCGGRSSRSRSHWNAHHVLEVTRPVMPKRLEHRYILSIQKDSNMARPFTGVYRNDIVDAWLKDRRGLPQMSCFEIKTGVKIREK